MAKNTTDILTKLRNCMKDSNIVKEPIQAYIIPTDDAHQSEYIAPCDTRRTYVSGFAGSAGTAVVTLKEALLWTDGRYYLQASLEMDNNWQLMKDGLPGTPSIQVWLSKNLPANSKVGVDANLLSCRLWKPIKAELESFGHSLVPVTPNLIDLIWSEKPSTPNEPIFPLELKYAGKKSSQKLHEIRNKMEERNAKLLVVTALDEIAWLLNMRGNDISYNPVFFAYVVITPAELHLFVKESKINNEIKTHFANEEITVIVHAYETLHCFLQEKAKHLEAGAKAWISPMSGYAISAQFTERQRLSEVSPILVMKSIKNPVEVEGMRNAHIRDAAALCDFFAWLEKQVTAGTVVTEISAAKKLEEFREMQDLHMGPSFETISAVGPHGSIIHFKPSVEKDLPITNTQLYLCDSGAQYRDGTTDVTRTMHFGSPSQYEKECFTRVFKGQTFLGTTVFPTKFTGNTLDCLARKFLWDIGLDYSHGTGHGIGMFLNVHEGPIGITFKSMPDDPGLQEGMFLSNEPGFYEDGKFGIRIENIVCVVKANTQYNFNQRGYLKFDTVTLVPIQTKMLEKSLLTEQEINYLNSYHKECRDVVGALLDKQGRTDAKKWLIKETEPI